MGEAGTCQEGECVVDPPCVPYPCEDRGECIVDSCDQGVCSYSNAPDGSTCADGSGKCKSGVCDVDPCAQVNCDDSDDCTIDGSCNPETVKCEGGGHAPIDTLCDNDSGFCDGLGSCVECNESAQCPDDANVCTTALCETGVCTAQNVPGSCSYMDGAGVCEAGVCVEAPAKCDPYPCEDGGECIADSCDQGVCSYSNAPDGSTCADGSGECKSGECDLCAQVNCDKGNECTIDGTCNPETGQCEGEVNKPIDTPCSTSEGRFCDGAGTCVDCNSAQQCLDDNQCTEHECLNNTCNTYPSDLDRPCNQGDNGRFCDIAGGCVECNRTDQCEPDGNVCTTPICSGQVCDVENVGGECVFRPGEPGTCIDGLCEDINLCFNPDYICDSSGRPCIVDECDVEGVCTYGNARNGTLCTKNSVNGECVAGACDLCAPSDYCADTNPCTFNESCNAATGECSFATKGDGESCGGASQVCLGGNCISDVLNRQYYPAENVSGRRSQLVEDKYFLVNPPTPWMWGLGGFYFNTDGTNDYEIDNITSGWYDGGGWARYGIDSSNNYHWRFLSQKLPIGTAINYLSGTQTSGKRLDRVIGALPAGYTPVLVGFNVNRSGSNHTKLKRLMFRVYADGPNVALTVRFADNTPTDGFYWSLRWALVPSHRVTYAGYKTDSDLGQADVSVIGQRAALQGFHMYFADDENIDRVGVRIKDNRLKVDFRDEGPDTFTYQVWWVDLE